MNFQDVIRDVHDEANHRLNTSIGNTTIFAVVNTAASGQASVALDSSSAFIGLVTVANTVPVTGSFYQATQPVSFGNVSISSNVAWADPKTYIGLVTIANTVPVTGTFYQSTQPVSFGNVTLSPSVNNIGFATVAVSTPTLYAVVNTGASNSNVTLNPSSAFIGLVTVANTVSTTFSGNVTIQDGGNSITIDGSVGVLGNVTLSNSNNFIGLVTVVQSSAVRSIVGNLTLSNSNNFIGLVTVVQSSAVRSIAGNLTLSNPNAYIGLTTTTLGIGTQFIGLVTANTINTGTNKNIVTLPIGFSVASVTTIAVPTNAAAIKVTNMVLSSDATVSLRMKSGVTYLTGNASIGVTILPGGGFVLNGSPDSPSWIGLPSGALVIEKFDTTATSAKIAGTINYFSE